MIKKFNCRDEVREAAIAVITQKGENIFAPNEITSYLKSNGH